jgi:hypothetical protein
MNHAKRFSHFVDLEHSLISGTKEDKSQITSISRKNFRSPDPVGNTTPALF